MTRLQRFLLLVGMAIAVVTILKHVRITSSAQANPPAAAESELALADQQLNEERHVGQFSRCNKWLGEFSSIEEPTQKFSSTLLPPSDAARLCNMEWKWSDRASSFGFVSKNEDAAYMDTDNNGELVRFVPAAEKQIARVLKDGRLVRFQQLSQEVAS